MAETILFLCPHGAAKSVLAMAYARRLAATRGLDLVCHAAGTEPDAFTSPAVVARLQAEGLDVTGFVPRKVTSEDLAAADWVVALGCEPERAETLGAKLVRWPDVPAPSQDFDAACRAIQARVAAFLAEHWSADFPATSR